jgi:hypothetical protein
MCTGLRDVIVTGMQRSSGCCGECLKYLGAVRELILFCLSPYDRGKVAAILTIRLNIRTAVPKSFSAATNLHVLSKTPMSKPRKSA